MQNARYSKTLEYAAMLAAFVVVWAIVAGAG
jgi:hypothetical protein